MDDAVFFALKPPLETAQRASRLGWHLRDQLGLTGEPLRTRCFHVSLFGIGYWGHLSDEMIATIGEAVAAVTMRRFLIAFDQAESFSGKPKRPLGHKLINGIPL
jgi:2'-5' RNA ligase